MEEEVQNQITTVETAEDEKQLPVVDDYRVLFSQGVHQYEMRNFEDASKTFLEVYDKFPEQTEALVNYGNCQYELLNTDEAIKYWQLAKEKDKYLINPYINLGNHYLANEKLQEAIDEYVFAFCLNPQNEMSTVNLAIAYEKMNDKKKAFMLYEFYLAGSLNVSSNTYKRIQKKVTLHKLNAISHMKLGIFFEKKGFWRKAIQSYFSSIKIFPNFAKTYSNIGNVFFKLEKYEFAKLYWIEAYKIDTKNLKLFLNLAICCEKTQDLISAYAFYAKFIQHSQSNSQDLELAQVSIANIHAQILANPDIAKSYNEKCKELEANRHLEDALVYYENLSLISSKEELKTKIQELKTEINLVHKAAFISFEMAKALFEKKNYEFAIEKCKLAKSLWKDSYFEQNINSLIDKSQTLVNTSITNLLKAKM